MKQMDIEEYDDLYKIILVGDSSVGKTNLIHCYSKEKIPTHSMPTIGVEYTSKIVPLKQCKKAKVQIWDTAGQEQYRSITMGHYKKAYGALILFDVTNPHSFSSVEYWANIVRQRADELVQIGIIGNKIDLVSKRAIPSSDGEMLAKKLNAFYHQTTVKDFGTIKDAFEKLVENVYETHKNRDEFLSGKGQRLNQNTNSGSGCSC